MKKWELCFIKGKQQKTRDNNKYVKRFKIWAIAPTNYKLSKYFYDLLAGRYSRFGISLGNWALDPLGGPAAG